MMTNQVQIIAVLGSLVMLWIIFKLLQARRLKEEYALTWIVIGVGFVLVAASRKLLYGLSELLGIYYPPAALFLVLITGAYLFLLHFSLVFSRLSQKNIEMGQELGLLRLELERIRLRLEGDNVADPYEVDSQDLPA